MTWTFISSFGGFVVEVNNTCCYQCMSRLLMPMTMIITFGLCWQVHITWLDYVA